ncbi:hypothetical protein BH18THE2_BH18THE2_37270 [soil metagenome]
MLVTFLECNFETLWLSPNIKIKPLDLLLEKIELNKIPNDRLEMLFWL